MELLLVGVSLAGRLAAASPDPVPPPPTPAEIELHWDAPAPCPSAEEIRARWTALLSGPPAGQGTMIVDAHVTEVDGGWRLDLSTRFGDVEDTRTLEARTCGTVAEATATLVAIALEPAIRSEATDRDVASAPEDVEPAPEPDPEIAEPEAPPTPWPPVVTIEDRHAPAPAESRPSRPGGMLRPSVGLEYGALPGVTASLGLAGGVLWPRARLEIEAGWLSPRTFTGLQQSRARAQMLIVAARGCLRPRVASVELPVCAGMEAGFVQADPVRIEGGRPARGPWLGPSLHVGVAYAWERLGLWAAAGVVGRAWGTQLVIAETVAFRPEIVSVRVAAGLEIFFGPAAHGSGRSRT